ncbi:hypothetical protein BOX15_Mlig014899g2 [Macrostomum lignano]|uniref:K Homology domain-containing protein n=2 Tax=Macrostomum lignano TaxID=282301 RepID=A0A267E0U6_9PLAT|nr:hypothetical protein BOX15_Mlig014899g2 [Macrostomum lignano]
MSNVDVEYSSRRDFKSDSVVDRNPKTEESSLSDFLSRVLPTLEHVELPKMGELDPESLLNLLANQKTTQASGIRGSELSDSASWRPILGCGLATRTEGTEAFGDANFSLQSLDHLSSSATQSATSSAAGTSAIEQMTASADFDNHLRQATFENRSRDLFQRLIMQASIAQGKRQITITERIQVPSSDHVAEIVGKNGLRIKQIREHLKVWVKTPTRDELPIFEVTGVPDKVAEAIRILQQMSEHFTRVQQERQTRTEPTRVEERLYVEQDKVGLIVGASGQTIRWVQQLSDTHIATPRKQEKQPGLRTCFTICGTKERVQFAKQLISEYVAMRCPGLWLEPSLPRSVEALKLVADFHQVRQTKAESAAPTVSVTPAAGPAAAASSDDVGADACIGIAQMSLLNEPQQQQTLKDARRLWPEQERPKRLWNSALFFGGLAEQRRYSADTPVSPITPAGAAGATADWPTAEQLASLKKVRSNEQLGESPAPNSAAFSGWM